MAVGFIHFDLRRGCRADMINGALASLLKDDSIIEQALSNAMLPMLKAVKQNDNINNLSGLVIHIYYKDVPIEQKNNFNHKINTKNIKYLWEGSTKIEHDFKYDNILLEELPLFKDFSLDSIKEFLTRAKLSNLDLSLCLRILNELQVKDFFEIKLEAHDALWLISHLVILVAQINALDPKFISATKILTFEDLHSIKNSPKLSLVDDRWIKRLLKSIPSEETSRVMPMDVLSLAFLKATCHHFGVRKDSLIRSIGVGFSFENENLVEALWCEPVLPDTMAELSLNKRAKLNFLYEINGLVAKDIDINELVSTLFLSGARSLSYHLVHDGKNSTTTKLSMIVSDDKKKSVLEILFLKGGVKDALINTVEQHELYKRLVSVALGHKNSSTPYQFYEYLYGDKTVYVEPTPESLSTYENKTNYQRDMARSDLLMAFKKYRTDRSPKE